MSRLTGPDFIAIQTEDLQAARAFYGDKLGLPLLQETPEAVVFNSKPVPFAVRKPLMDLEAAQGKLGWGIALWFACDDADALHEELEAAGTPIIFSPKDGPFGRYFAFRDPFGYTITAHTA
ncbi:VOC family protein [Hyphomicrobium sp. B1]|jgi:predicted enzyme related to lactoylglutathione lyase|uniref:VOC family protein n=1 Tax=unclassified Hyphomicrobium TaxID=2619925 RepID=UPI000213F8A8|nr:MULTISPECIES: VOC family protein [unclassified Hyphomicrobium]CCB63511.1 Glyoxalase/bleomycin resistance protein/dioxygenase [Hyphomicrobium sp. MC1]